MPHLFQPATHLLLQRHVSGALHRGHDGREVPLLDLYQLNAPLLDVDEGLKQRRGSGGIRRPGIAQQRSQCRPRLALVELKSATLLLVPPSERRQLAHLNIRESDTLAQESPKAAANLPFEPRPPGRIGHPIPGCRRRTLSDSRMRVPNEDRQKHDARAANH